jgi:hypothetical protein
MVTGRHRVACENSALVMKQIVALEVVELFVTGSEEL